MSTTLPVWFQGFWLSYYVHLAWCEIISVRLESQPIPIPMIHEFERSRTSKSCYSFLSVNSQSSQRKPSPPSANASVPRSFLVLNHSRSVLLLGIWRLSDASIRNKPAWFMIFCSRRFVTSPQMIPGAFPTILTNSKIPPEGQRPGLGSKLLEYSWVRLRLGREMRQLSLMASK